MTAHWTYSDVQVNSDLEQGDFLIPTGELVSIFDEIHPHFTSEKYLGFIVASQSCDLVRRKNKPKTEYISLAVVRPLSRVIRKLATNIAPPLAPGRFRSSNKLEIKQFLQRLVNQNEQALGLYFLYTNADMELGEPAVAMLRVSVSLKSTHYEALVSARRGRLDPAFQAKLGWLLGNLYNRPATPDWSDHEGGEERITELLKEYIAPKKAQNTSYGIEWIDDQIADQAYSKKVSLDSPMEELERLRPEPVIERALNVISSEITSVFSDTREEEIKKLKNRLRNNGKFIKLLQNK